MILKDLEKASLVLYAAREAGPRGRLMEMKGVCYCLRNRMRAGWYDSWIDVIEHAGEFSAHDQTPFHLDPDSRELQRMAKEVDEIFYPSGHFQQEELDFEISLSNQKNPCLYWSWVNRPVKPWFLENILKQSKSHPMRSQLGTMMFYE